jgi:hypothetical protein
MAQYRTFNFKAFLFLAFSLASVGAWDLGMYITANISCFGVTVLAACQPVWMMFYRIPNTRYFVPISF